MSVDVVAVGFEPIKWQAYCEECDKYVSDTTEDSNHAEKKGLVHLATEHVEQTRIND